MEGGRKRGGEEEGVIFSGLLEEGLGRRQGSCRCMRGILGYMESVTRETYCTQGA